MSILNSISNGVIPVIVGVIVFWGLKKKQDIYKDFTKGATDGFKTVMEIMPTLIGLMVAVGVLRTSGFLDFLTNGLQLILPKSIIPKSIIPIATIKLFSSSAATGLLFDLFKEKGVDSYEGIFGAVMLSSTETIFYTMSIYFMTVSIKKTRYTLMGAILATLAGIIASGWIAKICCFS